jgi:diguanylate cyclase (GGDEF)-like protein
MAIPARRASTSPLPASFLAVQIVQATAKPNAAVNELAGLCATDPGFATRMLSYVNSGGMGVNRRVASVQHAVSLLGIRGTRNLALGMCVEEMVPQDGAGELLLSLCLRRAVIARAIAEKQSRPNPDDYFTLGLLLEIGLLSKARKDIAHACELARAPAETRITLERTTGQEDHAKLGSRLARSWQLGDEMANALLHHHDRNPPEGPLGETAWLAERMAAVFESVDPSKTHVHAVDAGAQVNLPGDLVDSILHATPDAVSDAARHFGRSAGPQVSMDSLLRDANEALGELNRNYNDVVAKLEAVLRENEQLSAALRAADEKLSSLALSDALCGLPNRRAFHDALLRDLARADRTEQPIALLVLDVDHFEEINREHGQQSTDLVLIGLAQIMLRCVRVSDVAARIRSEAFAALLPNTNLQGALVVAKRMQAQLAERTFTGPKVAFPVTISIGVAVTSGPGCRGRNEALLAAAEDGLEIAKQNGRNRTMLGSL